MSGRLRKQEIFQPLVPPGHLRVSASKPLGPARLRARRRYTDRPPALQASCRRLFKNLAESRSLRPGLTSPAPSVRLMMEEPMTPDAIPADTGHRMRAPETWDAARAAYLDGESARDVCDRFDLTLSAFRAHARREGWRRADMADPDPDPGMGDELDDESPFLTREEMAEVAWRLAGRALKRGRAGETQRWLAVHARLAEQARADQRTETAAKTAEHKGEVQRIRAIGHAARDVHREVVRSERELHQLHQLHRALPDSSPPDTDSPAPPLSRAERRRLDKLRRKR